MDSVPPTSHPVVTLFVSYRFHARVTLLALLLALLFGPALNADEQSSYDHQLAAAQAFIQARDWTKARAAYSEATSLAPDEKARRWCELWLTLIPEKNDPYWSLTETSPESLAAYLETQLAPYAAGKARDDRWLSLKTCRAMILSTIEIRKEEASRTYWDYDMYQTRPRYSAAEAKERWLSWDDRIEITDYLEDLATTPEGIHRYIESLQQTVAMLGIVNQSTAGEQLRRHLQRAAALPAGPDYAAWCRLACARTLSDDAQLSFAQRDHYWAGALASARGTRWEKQTLAAELIWRIRRHDGMNAPDRSPVDLHAALLELKALHQSLGPLGRELLPGDPYTLENTISKLESPRLVLNGPTLLAPGQAATFSFAAANHNSLKTTLYRENRDEDVKALLAETNPVEERKVWEVPLDYTRAGVWNRGKIDLPGLSPGIYNLSVERETSAGMNYSDANYIQRIRFLVTDITAIEAPAISGATTLFFHRTSTGEPVAHAAVRILIASLDHPFEKHRLDLTTDATGHLQIPITAKQSAPASQELEQITVLVAGEVLQFRRSLPPKTYREFRAIVENSDASPGKEITVRILALNYQNGDLIPPSTPVYLNATLNNENLIRDRLLKFESDCIDTVRLPIPANTKPENIGLILLEHPGQTEDQNSLVCDLFSTASNAGYFSSRRLNVGLRPTSVPLGLTRQSALIRYPEDQDLVSLHDAKETWICTAQTVNETGKPVSFEGEARLVELKWDEIWLDPSGARVAKAAIKNYAEVTTEYRTKFGREQTPKWTPVQCSYVATTVAAHSVRTGSKGNITTRFKIPHAGIYQVQFWKGASRLTGVGGLARRDGRFDEQDDLAILAVTHDTTDLMLDPDYCSIFAPKIARIGAPLTATVILPERATSNTLCFSGLSETRFQPFASHGRVARVRIDRTPDLSGFGTLRLQDAPFSETNIAASEPRLPAGMQKVSQSLGILTHHRMALFSPPPSRDPEVFEVFREDEVSTETGFDLNNFLAQIGKRGAHGRIDDPNEQFKRETYQTPLTDNRVHPVLVGAEHGYCPESVPIWYTSPF